MKGAKGIEGGEGEQRAVKGAKGSKGQCRGAKGSKGYVILGFRVPTTSVGARIERVMRSEGGKGEQSILYTRF